MKPLKNAYSNCIDVFINFENSYCTQIMQSMDFICAISLSKKNVCILVKKLQFCLQYFSSNGKGVKCCPLILLYFLEVWLVHYHSFMWGYFPVQHLKSHFLILYGYSIKSLMHELSPMRISHNNQILMSLNNSLCTHFKRWCSQGRTCGIETNKMSCIVLIINSDTYSW